VTGPVEDARVRFAAEHDSYRDAADRTADAVRRSAAGLRLSCHVTGRAKDIPSFVKKAIVKQYGDPWTEITDKAGVRVIVDHQGRLDDALAAVTQALDIVRVEDDRDASGGEDRLAYQRLHVQAVAPGPPGPDGPLECEIQIRTADQDLWANTSHPTLYKPVAAPPRNVARPLYRLLALVELYDEQTEQAIIEMQQTPDYAWGRLLRDAETIFHGHVGSDYHLPLSEETTKVLVPLVGDLDAYHVTLGRFARDNDAKLRDVYDQYGPLSAAHQAGSYVLVGQPESVVVFERLATAPEALRAAWVDALPTELLDEAASVWGTGL